MPVSVALVLVTLPLGPYIATNSLGLTLSETPSTARTVSLPAL
jgi:hypothetical protein